MNSLKEGQFPAASIGRSTAARVQQAASEAHPLLSSGSVSPPADGSGGAPKYLPYTPRHRAAPAATTTGTIVHPPSPQGQQGNATSKLQLMHLKAAAQNVGLDTSTVGWAILEKLGAPNDGEEWSEIWNAISMGKAIVMLPLEQTSANEIITADLVKDHIFFWDGYSEVVTMSGLRANLSGPVLTFRSTIATSTKLFQDILSPLSRSNAFGLLPRLPQVSSSYPRVAFQSEQATLPLPPRAPPVQKPPLPPRPGARPTGPGQAPSRIPNPFASLFGGNPSKNAVSIAPSSPPASIRSFDSTNEGAPIELTALTIDRKIVRKGFAKQMNKALKSELREMLTSATDATPPAWVVDRTIDFTAGWFPFVRVKDGNGAKEKEREYGPNPLEEGSDDAADRLQDFYGLLEHDLLDAGSPFLPSSKSRGSDRESNVDDEKARQRRGREQEEAERRVRDVMEAVERSICSLFYDRLFMQSTTDDTSHDETLTSRICALNMLDLGLNHLDIIAGDIEPDLNVVVHACGEMLSQLDPCRCPADKSAILVAAHKVLVDGLSRLPPIRLKADDEPQTARPVSRKNSEPQLSHLNILRSTSSQSLVRDDDQTPTVASMARMHTSTASPLPVDSKPLPVIEKAEPEKVQSKLTLDMDAHPKEPTPVSGDILFPILIFSVVKANPPHLLSNLLFTQRFRNHTVGGEEAYCLINLMAVAEFLENVDLEALGLTDSDKVLSAADLTPIPLTRSPVTSETPLAPADGQSGLRNRMEQQVDAIADSANKVISGVVDSSFGILRSFLPNNSGQPQSGGSRPTTPATSEMSSSWRPGSSLPKPGFGLLRRDSTPGSGFSIANIAASLPISRRSRSNTGEESGQQLISVSRPSSAGSRRSSLKIRVAGDSSQEESASATSDDDDDDDEEDEDEDHERREEGLSTSARSTRSIQSFESMVAAEKARNRKQKASSARSPDPATSPPNNLPRKSLSDRLARVSTVSLTGGMKAISPRQDSLLLQPPHQTNRGTSESPASSRSPSPIQHQSLAGLAPPIERFVNSSPGDLRLSEVADLLRDYKRLVEAIRAVDGFDE
ncbi:hypothetical protein FA15DRAFT_137771 [Coprinopsis marcescibilis]|uniref:VPS9 domain-containing protein n=1 Tax=Coprinopsis marcescibilis TaxID=230819 RepID=A0A5C3KJ69_COPMA|nr:hypothetical protein FA15DRAFT_137771 [Coprinopsis marcescibilis]